jgi:RHS repeat-associated protein
VTDADGNIAQHVEYIPYGEVFVEERNSQFSTNYLFNAKELDNETGLYYYGARYLDPTGAMWLSVDPLFEKYAGMSPYNYCAGNPVKLVDPDGREATPEFEVLLKQTEKFAAEKLKDPSISDKERREYESVFSEAEKLRNSNQTYHVEYKDLTTGVQTGDTKYNAYTIYDPSNDRVTVVMNNKAEDYDPLLNPFPKSEAGLADFAHEAKHCYQFEVGLHSFNEKGGVGHLYDYGDEVEAHYRGFVFGADKPDPEYSYKKFGLIPRGMNVESIKKGSIMMIEENKYRFYFRHEGKTYKPNRTK